jgi:uncharacterized protein (TIGR03437 family)
LSAADLPAGSLFDPASGLLTWTPSAFQQGAYDLAFTATSPGGDTSTEHFILNVDSGAPVVTRVVNAASRSKDGVCSPGAIASLEGRWLVDGITAADPTGQSLQLSGTTVSINGEAVPLLYASATRVDFLCPDSVPGAALEIVAQTQQAASQPVQTIARDVTPGIFSVDGSGTGQGTIWHATGLGLAMLRNYQYQGQPGQASDPVIVYATGISRAARISVKLGGMEVVPDSVAPAPGLPGLSRVAFTVPKGAAGNTVTLSLVVQASDGSLVESTEVSIAIEGLDK